jgi:hypothetical protein
MVYSQNAEGQFISSIYSLPLYFVGAERTTVRASTLKTQMKKNRRRNKNDKKNGQNNKRGKEIK